jgi:hypothetical protein
MQETTIEALILQLGVGATARLPSTGHVTIWLAAIEAANSSSIGTLQVLDDQLYCFALLLINLILYLYGAKGVYFPQHGD